MGVQAKGHKEAMNQLIKAGYIKTCTEGMMHSVTELCAQLPAPIADTLPTCAFVSPAGYVGVPKLAACSHSSLFVSQGLHRNIGPSNVHACCHQSAC